jgi:hypothetical protein
LLLVHAAWIVAEILFYREAVKKIAADSPVFLSALADKKNAPMSLSTPHSPLHVIYP